MTGGPAGSTTQDELKRLVGAAAVAHVAPGSIVGVGTGSTVNCFIDALGRMPTGVAGAVSSSEASTKRLAALGIRVLAASEVESSALSYGGRKSSFVISGGVRYAIDITARNDIWKPGRNSAFGSMVKSARAAAASAVKTASGR